MPYACILGNHDAEGDITRAQAIDLLHSDDGLSLTQQGPKHLEGAGNYYLSVFPGPEAANASASESRSEALRIWLLDSQDRGCGWLPLGWGCVGRKTLQWVKGAAGSDGSTAVPGVAFIHIPMPEFMWGWSDGNAVHGDKGEPVSCPSGNIGEHAAAPVLRNAGVTAVYSGHDHDNNYHALWGGVRYAYGQKSGFGSYGPASEATVGARIVRLRLGQDPSVAETWIRLANGTRIAQPMVPVGSKAMAADGNVAPKAAAAADAEPQQRWCAVSFKYEYDLWKLRRLLRQTHGPAFESAAVEL